MQSPLSILTLNGTTLFLYHVICIFASSLCCLLCDKMMILCFWALIHKANANKIHANSTAQSLPRTYTEESKAQARRSWVSLDCPPPTLPGRQEIRSDCLITSPTPCHVRGGGRGVCQQKRGGFSGPNDNIYTNGSTAPKHFIYAYVGPDAMSNTGKSISMSGDTMIE